MLLYLLIFNLIIKDNKYYDIGDIYIGYGNPQTNVLYLQYKWINALENPNLNDNPVEVKEKSGALLENDANIRINKEASSINKKSDKTIDRYFNNSSMVISEIKENTDKSNQFNFFLF